MSVIADTVMGVAGIKSVLPHRYPMLLVDRVLDLVPGERVTALKAVTCNEPWYSELPPAASDRDHDYPRVLLVESWCQAAGVLVAADQPNPDVLTGKVMLFGGISDIRFTGRVRPGDVMEHHVHITRALSETVIVEGECRVGGRNVAEIGRVIMALRPAAELSGRSGDEQSDGSK